MEDISTQSGLENNKAEMKTASIKKNYVYSLLNKLLAVVVPILVTPYIARVLGADGNGVISYVGSISSYFILVANIGIETYGQRVIAIHREDKSYLKKFFIEITILRTILTAVCLAVYSVCFISSINKTNNVLYAIFALSIFAVIFDFSWFFQGVENFRLLALVNITTRIAYVVLIFLLVKTKQDLNVAALLSVCNTILPFFLSIPFLFRYTNGKITGRIKPFSHFKECMVYFIPTIAIQIYTVLDKTMIGLITRSDFENGYYEQAEKLVKLPLTLITTLFIIMRSRISYYFSQERYDDIKNLIEKSSNIAFGFSFPLMLGIIATAPTLVPVYLGTGYDKCVMLLYVFSPIIPIISLSNLIGTHYYTPFNKQKTSNIFLISGAVLNVALNSFLIYFLQSAGAAIASVCAELFIAVLYVVFARKFIDVKVFVKVGYKYLIASLLMFVPVFIMTYYLPVSVWYLLAEICTGIAIYAVALLVLRVKFVYDYIRIFKNKIKNKFTKKQSGENTQAEEDNVQTADGETGEVEGEDTVEPTEDKQEGQEEVICGFKVSRERKKVWQTELEMVRLFIEICEKAHLKYVVSGGTLLGAVRHNGFIPWDDDIDIMMPRKDYEEFLKIGQENLPSGFFLQYNKTEKKYPNGHAQIRNVNTACFMRSGYNDLKTGKNCGIFIDIFPYDDVPDDLETRNKQAKKIAFLKKMCAYRIYKGKQNFVKKVIKKCVSAVYFVFHRLEKTIEKINVLSQEYNGKTNTVALVSFMPGYEKNVWDKALFDKVVQHKFEDIEVAIPEKYDEVLRREFGEYMQIPENKDGSIHGVCYFDVDKPYGDYRGLSQEEFDNLFKDYKL